MRNKVQNYFWKDAVLLYLGSLDVIYRVTDALLWSGSVLKCAKYIENECNYEYLLGIWC